MPEPRVKWTPQGLQNKVENIVRRAVLQEGVDALQRIRWSFPRGGVSRPGQPPAVQTGQLSRDLRAFIENDDTLIITVAPGSQDKALALEFGAPSRNLRPRPFLTPQREISRQRLAKKLTKQLKQFGVSQ
jgi:hypothetical protein